MMVDDDGEEEEGSTKANTRQGKQQASGGSWRTMEGGRGEKVLKV